MIIPNQIASGSVATLGCDSFNRTQVCPQVSKLFKRAMITSLTLSLFLLPSSVSARTAHLQDASAQSAEAQEKADQAREDQQEKEQERREREQERRDREQEARDREQERIDRQQELYDNGREALDDDHYEKALQEFAELIKLNGPQTDAAMYWKAYTENRLGRKAAALATIADIKAKYAQSRWKKDADALEIEVRQSSNQQVKPEEHGDAELYNLALQGLMNSSPDRAIPLIGKKLNGSAPVKDKAKLLFILAQSGRPEALDILANIARGQSNPELQRKAIEYLSMFGGDKSHKLLADVYSSSSDESVRRAVIKSYLLSGDKASLFAAAKNEKNESLRREAIRTLGLTGGTSELDQLYKAETSTDLKREILQAFFLSGDSARMEQAALNEKDVELRRSAIRNLGLMGHSDLLQSIYAKETDRSLKDEVLNAYFISGNAKALVAIAKTEKDPSLKKEAVQKLSLMGSKEGNDYLMEILEK
jgi:HEAT repeat protein